jgi:hypothetical protein
MSVLCRQLSRLAQHRLQELGLLIAYSQDGDAG